MLGERLHAEVEGVFVEDIDLVHLAELPVGRELHLISGHAHAFDRELLENQFGAEAAEARRTLRTLTERAQVRSTFRVVRGRVDVEIIAAAGAGDLLVLGTFSRSIGGPRRPGATAVAAAERAPRSVLLLRRGAKIAGRPIAVHDGSDGADAALDAAVRLAAGTGKALTVLVIGETAEAADVLQARIADHLAARQVEPQFLRVPRLELDELCRVSRRTDADVLVLDADSPVLAGEARERLLEDVGCAILLVR
jgi:nucleotide-binding universal stress UspA family protein